MEFLNLATSKDFEYLLSESEERPVVLFKHSSTCATSYRASHEMSKLTEPNDPPVFRLIVQRARNLSYEIAERTDIRHESPQIIIFVGRNAIYHASHFSVTAQAVREIVLGTVRADV